MAYCYRPSSVHGLSVSLPVCHSSEPCENGSTDRDAVWVADSDWPKNHVLDGRPHSPSERVILKGGRGGPTYSIGTLCGELCNKCSAIAEMGVRLATIDMGQKECSFQGELGPHLTQCGLGRGLLRTKWHLDPSSRLTTIHGPKSGRGLMCPCPFFAGSWVPI